MLTTDKSGNLIYLPERSNATWREPAAAAVSRGRPRGLRWPSFALSTDVVGQQSCALSMPVGLC